MSKIQQYNLRKQSKKRFQNLDKFEAWLALVGDGNGNVIVPTQTNYRYVRPVGSNQVLVVHKGPASDVEGAYVWVGRHTYRPDVLTILGVDPIATDGGASGLEAHADTHYINGSDPIYITDNQITPLLVYPKSGLTVHVNPGWITYQGQPAYVSAIDLDLTSNIPAAGAQYSLIRISSTGIVSVQDGTPVDSFADLGVANIPDCADGYAAIAFVRLYFGQTTISSAVSNSPDVRTLVWGGGLFDQASGSDVDAIHDNVAGEIAAIEEKASPVSADMLVIEDSEDSDAKKMVQIGNLPASALVLDHGVYLYSTCFWSDGTNKDLVLLVSADGYQFAPISIKPLWTEDETHYLQEPSIIWHNDYWYIAYTYGETGTADSTSFKVIQSPDLINWTLTATVDMSAITGVDAVWAPELFIDGDTIRVYSTCTTNEDHINGFKIYEVHATAADLSTWSAPAEVTGTGLPSSIIDAFVFKDGSTYYLFYKDNATEYICYATSTSPASGFTEISDGDWASWGVRGEGPTVIQLPDGRWRAYIQHYEISPSYEATQWWSEADAIDDSWSEKVQVVSPWPIVHGTVLRVTDPDALGIILAAALQAPGGLWRSDTGDVGFVLNAGVNDAAGDQKSYIELRLNNVLKSTIKVDEATSGSPLEITGAMLRDDYTDIEEISAPSSPAANIARLYSKDDGGTTKLYYKRSDGTEIELGGEGGGFGGGATAVFAGEVLLDETAGAGGVASFTVSDIDPAYAWIEVVLNGRTEGTTNDWADVRFSYNGDTTAANYRRIVFYGSDSTMDTIGEDSRKILTIASSKVANCYGQGRVIIADPGNSTKHKVATSSSGFRSGASSSEIHNQEVSWENTAAITSILIEDAASDDFAQYTRCIVIGYRSRTVGGHGIQDEGTPVTDRTNINFEGFTFTDDEPNDAIVITALIDDHDHSGDVGDGGQFPATNLTSDVGTTVADDGFVLTADGAGNTAWEEPPAGGGGDASDITFTPADASDWIGSADPGNVDDALDQLADRIYAFEAVGIIDAEDVSYDPGDPADWTGLAPSRVDSALDMLADDVASLKIGMDASIVTYTPAVLTDWDSDADPGDVDNALDQLAERLDDLEGASGHDAVTLDGDAAVLLDLTGQEIGLDTQTANYVFAGPASGAANEPTFRALVEADIISLLAGGWISAGETWTYASADDPTYTFTIASFDATTKYSAGMRLKLTQTSVKYFIITKVVYDNPGSTITVYGGTDYDLADAAISANYYSMQKSPIGFPLDPLKWTVEISDTSDRAQATPSATTWYNPGSITISIPIGSWRVIYQCSIMSIDTNVTAVRVKSTLSTANNSESDADFTTSLAAVAATGAAIAQEIRANMTREKYLALTSKTSYYLNILTAAATADSISIVGAASKTIIRAVSAYL